MKLTYTKKNPAPALGCLVVLAIVAINAAWIGWIAMIAAGVIHSFVHDVPAFGFWPSLGIGLLIAAISSILSGQ